MAASVSGQALPAPLQVLGQAEASALLSASGERTRLLCTLALMGLSTEEALTLRVADFDTVALRIHVGGAWARQLPMPPWLPQVLPKDLASASLVLQDASGQPLSSADVTSMVLSGALDAGLPHAASIGWDVLRDTAIDWLVGQGIRYSELPKVVGRVEAQKLQALSSRHGDARRQELAQVDTLMPALRLEPQG